MVHIHATEARAVKYLVKEEDVPARSSQHTVRALRGEYASVTQKLCKDEHTGGGGEPLQDQCSLYFCKICKAEAEILILMSYKVLQALLSAGELTIFFQLVSS